MGPTSLGTGFGKNRLLPSSRSNGGQSWLPLSGSEALSSFSPRRLVPGTGSGLCVLGRVLPSGLVPHLQRKSVSVCKCVRARVCMHGTFKCRPGPHTNYLESQCHTSGRHACRSVPSNPPASYPRIPQQKGRPGATKLSPTFPHTTDNSFSAAWGTTSTYNAFKIQINQAQSHSALWVLE